MIARLLAGATLILTTSAAPAAGQAAQMTTPTPATRQAPTTPTPPDTRAGQGPAPEPRPATTPTTPTPGNAQPASATAAISPSAAGAGLVELTVVGAEGPYQSLRDRIGAHAAVGGAVLWSRLDRFNPLDELLRGQGRPGARSLRCWVDLSDLRRATLYFAAPGGQRFLVRDVALSGRLDEIDQQSLAQVLELSIAALLEDEHAGLSLAQARAMLSRAPAADASAAATAAPPAGSSRSRREPGWELMLGLFYAVEDVAAALPVAQGPGLDLALRSPAARRAAANGQPEDGALATTPAAAGSSWGLWLDGQYQLPRSAQTADIGVRLQTAAVRAGVEGERWHLRARLGAGLDWSRVTPLPGNDGTPAALAASHWSQTVVLTSAIAARLSMGRATSGGHRPGSLTLALFVDVVPETVRYQVQDATGTVRVAFAPRRVRPGLAVGLSF